MENVLEQAINGTDAREVRLHGKIRLDAQTGGSFTVGRLCVKAIVTVARPYIVVDGSDAEIEVYIDDCTTSDWSLFSVLPSAGHVTFRHMRVRVHIANPTDSGRMFSLVYNTAYGLKIEDCFFAVTSEKQLQLTGIYNNGNSDTHLDTRADNLVVVDSTVRVECRAETFTKACTVCGIYNYLANSIAVQNTYVYAFNRGDGDRQKAIGVYTNGRFGRFVGNNIKANGSHPAGKEREQAHAFGFVNEGLYSILSANNLVGEWAGMCVGLENKGAYTIVESNKILATHTVCGRSIRNYAVNCRIVGNIVTSTARHARLIEQRAGRCMLAHNIMEVLMPPHACKSGVGVYALGEACTENRIENNMIVNVLDCGIFADDSVGTVEGNSVYTYPDAVKSAGTDNETLAAKLDERNVRTEG